MLDLKSEIKKLEKENEMLHDQLDEAKAQYSGLNGVIESSTKRLKTKIKDQDETINTILKHITNPQLALGLQVGFCTSGQHYENCTIITSGKITYVEN